MTNALSPASSLLPFFGTRLRRQIFNLAPTQYRQLRRLCVTLIFLCTHTTHATLQNLPGHFGNNIILILVDHNIFNIAKHKLPYFIAYLFTCILIEGFPKNSPDSRTSVHCTKCNSIQESKYFCLVDSKNLLHWNFRIKILCFWQPRSNSTIPPIARAALSRRRGR